MTEAELQTAVADYLRLQYPSVLFHSDYGSGIKLTMGQAIKQKRQNGGRRAWPDMFIAKLGYEYIYEDIKRLRFGLFIELKKDGARLYKKNGEPASEHIAEQAETLKKLREEGYVAEFAVGFEQAQKIIDDYLRGDYAEAN